MFLRKAIAVAAAIAVANEFKVDAVLLKTDAEFLENPTEQPVKRNELESELDQVANGGSKASTVGEGDSAASVLNLHEVEFSHGAPEISVENPTQQQHSPADMEGSTRGFIRRRDAVDGTVTSTRTSGVSDMRFFGGRCLKVLILVGTLIAIVVVLTQTYHPGSDSTSTSTPVSS